MRESGDILGTLQYTAPEYFLGQPGTRQSDLFSLGVIAYQMLTGALPYGAALPRATSLAQQKRLRYVSAVDAAGHVPAWIDAALAKAVRIDPALRHEALSEFIEDLRKPNPSLVLPRPISQRNPVQFWQMTSLVLLLIILALLYHLLRV